MDVEKVASELIATAAASQQATIRISASDPIDDVRKAVRRLAKERGLSVRTGLVDDVLAVVRSDADIWHESTATMRAKLIPTDGVSFEG